MKFNSLTLQFVPYDEIASLSTPERIKKLLRMVIEGKIILLQGRLKPQEEARLIEDTMVLVGTIKGFKGIELAVLSDKEPKDIFKKIRKNIAKALVGEKDAITLIGPASIVREVKKDPGKIQLLLKK